MKITVIERYAEVTWEINQLIQESSNLKHEINVIDLTGLNDFYSKKNEIGDAVIWRSATVRKTALKTVILRELSDRIIINDSMISQPFLPYKTYQQHIIEKNTSIPTIPSSHFIQKALLLQKIKQGAISLPLIKKPYLGGYGLDIELLTTNSDLTALPDAIDRYIFQPFIENNGDYRIFVVGGIPLGAIKRTAPKNKFLNNVSQGGSTKKVMDEKLIVKLFDIATQASAQSGLHVVGVDVLEDKEGNLSFLEINTDPQWQGFQKTTDINVGQKIIQLCQHLHQRQRINQQAAIQDYYLSNLESLSTKKQYHFLNRLWLWTRNDQIRKLLDQKKSLFLGSSKLEINQKIKAYIDRDPIQRYKTIRYKKARAQAIKSYPNLIKYSAILEMAVLSQNVYQENIVKDIASQVSLAELSTYRQSLIETPEHIAMLSTRAINYLFSKQNPILYPQATPFPPENYLIIANEHYDPAKQSHIELQLYLLTHLIINASDFYNRSITQDLVTYKKALHLADQLIHQHYHQIRLDIKLEFVIACQLLDHLSPLADTILGEATRSYSNTGNFIVDTKNDQARSSQNNPATAEHLNAMLIIASQKPKI